MKILLINPIMDIYPKQISKEDMFPPMPLGILYLASVAEEEGHKVIVKNSHYSNFKKIIRKIKPDILGITCITAQYNQAQRIAQIAKKTNKNITTIIGGCFPSARWASILDETSDFDYIFVGEAELTFKEFLKKFNNKKELEKVKGLAFKKNNKIKFTGPRLLIKDLDTIPFPARHLSEIPMPILITSRGCSNNCKFCTIKSFYSRSYRRRSLESVLKEILLLRKAGFNKINLRDDNFFINKNYVVEFCKLIEKQGFKDMEFVMEGDINFLIDKENLELLKKINVRVLRVGIQSTSSKSMRYLGVNFDYDLIKRFFRVIKEYNFTVNCFFIMNSGESKENMKIIKKNAQRFCNLLVQHKDGSAKFIPQILILDPYPGTDIEKDFIRRGIKIEHEWSLFRCYYCNYEYNDINKKRLESLHEKTIAKLNHNKKHKRLLIKIKEILYLSYSILKSDMSFKIRLEIILTYLVLELIMNKSNYEITRFIYKKYF